MRKYILSLIFVLGVAGPAGAQQIDIYDSGGPILPEQAAFDVTYYEIDLGVDPSARSIAGGVTTVARILEPTRRLVLDLDTTFTVSRITELFGGRSRELPWERRGGRLWIDLERERAAGSTAAVRVEYSGNPRVAPQAPWDGGFVWARTEGGQPWIATAVQGEGPDVWWPSKDHVSDKPDSVGIHIRVPEPLVVATNGRLRDVDGHEDDTRTYRYHVSTPISAYNIALNIAPYEIIEGELDSVAGEEMEVLFFALPEDEERAEDFMPEIIDHLEFHEELLGPYPFRADGYKVAQTPHLGMEHQTVIAYGADFDNGAMTGGVDWGFDALHHHELSHEWWGNMVTNRDWKDMWIHEGFGTYMQALYAERLGGPDLYRGYMNSQREYIVNRAAVAPRESRTSGEIYFDSGSDIYGKGAWVLHSLRFLLGDEDFFEAFRRMAYPDPADEGVTDGSHVRFATTDDFLEIAERVSGKELDWFFEVYLRQGALPTLAAQRQGDVVRFRWAGPGGLPFPMPLEVEVDGGRTVLPMTGGEGQITVPAGTEVIADPDGWILRSNQGTSIVR